MGIFGGRLLLKRVKSWVKNLVLTLIPSLGKRNQSENSNPRIVVLVNWENLGDFVLFSSVIRETKRNFPHSKLFVVAQSENSSLVDYCPYVDRWIWVKGHQTPKSGEGHGKATSYGRKMFVTYLALLRHGKGRIELLIGPDWLLVDDPNHFTENFIFKHFNEGRNSLSETALRNRQTYIDHSHQVERMFSILKMFGLNVNSDEIENWTIPEARIKQAVRKQPDIRKNILISLGAGQLRRNWPLENVLTLIPMLVKEFPDLDLTILGPQSFNTQKYIEALSNLENVNNLIGKTSLSEVSELMLHADLMISNDSGLVHIAATLKLPCVVVSAHPINGDPWHLHSPNRYHPWKTKYIELQPDFLLSPCRGSCQSDHPHCIAQVGPLEVFEACKSLVNQS